MDNFHHKSPTLETGSSLSNEARHESRRRALEKAEQFLQSRQDTHRPDSPLKQNKDANRNGPKPEHSHGDRKDTNRNGYKMAQHLGSQRISDADMASDNENIDPGRSTDDMINDENGGYISENGSLIEDIENEASSGHVVDVRHLADEDLIDSVELDEERGVGDKVWVLSADTCASRDAFDVRTRDVTINNAKQSRIPALNNNKQVSNISNNNKPDSSSSLSLKNLEKLKRRIAERLAAQSISRSSHQFPLSNESTDGQSDDDGEESDVFDQNNFETVAFETKPSKHTTTHTIGNEKPREIHKWIRNLPDSRKGREAFQHQQNQSRASDGTNSFTHVPASDISSSKNLTKDYKSNGYSPESNNLFIDEPIKMYNQKPRIYSLEQNQASKGRLVTFYKNGDIHFKGLHASVSDKEFKRFETLLKWLDQKIPTPRGVRHVFQLPEGLEIHDIAGFVSGRSYVVSSINRLKRVSYGSSSERYWSNKPPSGSRFRRSELGLLDVSSRYKSRSYPASRTSSIQTQYTWSEPTRRGGVTRGRRGGAAGMSKKAKQSQDTGAEKPRVLTIISNTNRECREKVIMNPQTTQTYEQMLSDIGAMMQLAHSPIQALWTSRKPYKQVRGFSHLLRGLRHFDTFIAVGQEGIPVELESSPDTIDPHPATPDLLDGDETDYQTSRVSNRDPNSYKSGLRSINGYTKNPKHYKSQTKPTHSKEDFFDQLEQVHEDRNRDTPVQQIAPVSQDQDVIRIKVHGQTRELHVPRYAKAAHSGDKPDKRLKLDWLYGYRGRDACHNLLALTSGELVYHVAAVGVVYHPESEHQRHYTEHTEDITSIALHPSKSKQMIATGQLAGPIPESAAHVRVWDANSLVTYAIVGFGVFHQAIISLGFSTPANASGSDKSTLLLAIDKSEKHTLSVWHWQKDNLIAKTSTTTDLVVLGRFHPADSTSIITAGKNHLYFWKLFWNPTSGAAGKILRDKQSGVFHDNYSPSAVTSIAFSERGDVITGDADGGLVVWQRDDNEVYSMTSHWAEGMRDAHKKGIFSLCMMESGLLLSCGGQEIQSWDTRQDYQLIKRIQLSNSSGSGRTLAVDARDTTEAMLYVGTSLNTVVQGSFQTPFKTIVQAQNTYEEEDAKEEGAASRSWSMAVHPASYVFVTAGTDQQVIKWNALTHRLEWRTVVEKPCTCVSMEPEGRAVVVGTTSGRFIVLSALDGMHIFSMQAGTHQLNTVVFSPDGNYLALGSRDCSIYVYRVEDDAQVFRKHKVGLLRGHGSAVTHLDWSRDAKHLRSVSDQYELLNWSIDEMREVTSESMRDTDWSTHNCLLTYHNMGAWTNLDEGEEISSTDTSHNKHLLAVGDNQGSIRLYKNPCATNKPKFESQKPYTGNVARVAFTFDDHYFLSSGGEDAAIMQWTLINSR